MSIFIDISLLISINSPFSHNFLVQVSSKKGAYKLKESKPKITWIGVVLIFVVCMVIAGFTKPRGRVDSTESMETDKPYDFELTHFNDNFGHFINVFRNQDLWQY